MEIVRIATVVLLLGSIGLNVSSLIRMKKTEKVMQESRERLEKVRRGLM